MNRKIFYIVIFSLIAVLAVRMAQSTHKASKYINGQSVTVDGFLLTEPSISENRQRFFMTDQDGTRVTIVVPLFPAFRYGDYLHVSGKVNVRVLDNEQTVNAIYFPTVEAGNLKENNGFFLTKMMLAWSSAFRDHFSHLFRVALPPQEANLLMGIVLGVKQDLSEKLTQDLRSGGVFHVVAASGMNVSLVASFFTVLFASLWRRQVVLVVTILGIWFYAAVSGFQPSIVRASIMSTVVFLSQVLGRQSMPAYSLSLTAVIMLIVSPVLIGDVGFQLSFASTLGLQLLQPLQRVRFFKKFGSVGADVTTTVSAQLATLPILLANFGTYSLWSVLLNGLVLWTIPPLMIFGGVAGLIGFATPLIGQFIVYLCIPFLWYFQMVVTLFGRFTSPIHIDSVSTASIIGYYLILLGFIIWLRKRSYEESDS